MQISPVRFFIDVPGSGAVDAALIAPDSAPPQALFVFAHGAGAGMRHAFMVQLSVALMQRGIATLRFQFPYMQQQSRRPDRPEVAQSAVRAAVSAARERMPGVPLFAGGKSFGGRMTSGAQASEPLEGVNGIVFVGFPLHPPKDPGIARAAHLDQVKVPMLFLQGTRDELAGLALIREVTAALGMRATLHVVEGGDHSFDVLVRSGRTAEQVMAELADTAAQWMGAQRVSA
ncbi:MAG TPA: alpha/beta family hydrolase [Ramlibacter sp.]|nr:alpha/beta family hydrolase [Ramlibacter sp.]